MRSSETSLPPVRRTRRRDWGRVVARVMCAVFAIVGLVPASVALLVRTSWARSIATRETRKVVAGFGVDASYDLELRLWPLSVGLRNVRVKATDGGTPFVTARSATMRPKIFGLLAGKLVIDSVEVERPAARVVLKGGKLANLELTLPESKSDAPKKLPFSVVSASDADVDVQVDDLRFVGHEVDADVTSDEDADGNAAYEVALRVTQASARTVRTLKAPVNGEHGDYAVDEDVLCRIDGRARIEGKRILVRRFAAYGAADLENAEGTSPGCAIAKDDKRYVELAFGHLAIGLPKAEGDLPTLDGHAKVRAPLRLVDRLPGAPDVDGWIMVDAELRYTAETPIPDMAGRLEAGGVRVSKFNFARTIKSDFAVRRSVVTSPLTTVEIADGTAQITNVEVKPLAEHVDLKATVDITNVNFTSLMKELGVAQHPRVTWDLHEVHATRFTGTLNPLHLDSDFNARTTNFGVYDAAIASPTKQRVMGVAEGNLAGKVAVRPLGVEFHDVEVHTTRSVVHRVLVSLAFHEDLIVDVPSSTIDLADITPLGHVPIAGLAEASAHVVGRFGDPHLEGDTTIKDFKLGEAGPRKDGDIEFGNVTQAHVSLEKLDVSLSDVRVQKNKSTYEMPTGRLEFGGDAAMKMDGTIVAKSLGLRDFLDVFHLDEDPRLADLDGTLETNARMHLALGGPEDVCKGGFLDVLASTTARDLNFFGEKFDEGTADFEYKWTDRFAGIDGADVDVRSLSLTKVKKEGRASVGSVLGSLSVQRGGSLRGSLVVQGYPLGRADLFGKAAENIEGTASGVARLGGTLDAFDVDADLDVTPVRVFGAPFGSSDLHVTMTQAPSKGKVIGHSPCGATLTEPFDKDKWARDKDRSVSGDVTIDGKLFGGQVALDHVVVTRQKAPVITGHVDLAKVDLAPIGKLLVPASEAEAEAGAGGGASPSDTALGGEISGAIDLERVATDDLAHAKATFAPRSIAITRGGQRVAWRPPAATQPPAVFKLEDDAVSVPQVTFDLTAQNGLKGAVTVDGSIAKITHGGELGLDATLTPIDLGILVGIVPRMTRATGTLQGTMRLGGKATSPTFDGQLEVRNGEFAVKGLPSTISDVNIDITADETEARVARGSGKFLGGDVGLTARMPLKTGQLGVVEANLTGRQLYISPIEGVKATVDADLTVSINPQATTAAGRLPFIGGDVTVVSFEYTKPISLELNGLAGGAKRTVIEAYDPTQDAVTLGFDVHSRAPLRLRNNLVDANLAIDPRGIHVSGTNQRIGLRGEVNSLPGGHFRLFANDFEIQKSSIRFDDPTRIVPHVDVTATTEYRRYTNTLSAGAGAGAVGASSAGASGGSSISTGGQGVALWRITLHAYGDGDNLHVDMTSEPALSNEDIFFLLTIGLTRAEVDQVQAGSVYASAAFEAIGTVSGVDRAVKQAIPVIDDFRTGSAYSPITGRVEPNVTVGRRITDTVRARVTSGLAEDPQLRGTIEWRLGRSFTVEPSVDRNETTTSSNLANVGIDFRWRLEFN